MTRGHDHARAGRDPERLDRGLPDDEPHTSRYLAWINHPKATLRPTDGALDASVPLSGYGMAP